MQDTLCSGLFQNMLADHSQLFLKEAKYKIYFSIRSDLAAFTALFFKNLLII